VSVGARRWPELGPVRVRLEVQGVCRNVHLPMTAGRTPPPRRRSRAPP